MSLTPSELGALLIVVFAVLTYLRIAATLTALLGLVSVVLLGTSGLLGRLLDDVTTFTVRLFSQLGANIIGSASLTVLTAGLALVYAHDMHPKNPTLRRTAWIGVALGSLIVAGLTGIPALAGLQGGIVHATQSVIKAL